MRMVLNNDDELNIDMTTLMSFDSTSVDFWSNNKNVILPGIQRVSKDDKRALSGQSFHPISVKSNNNNIFMIETDQKKMSWIQVESLSKMSKKELELLLDGEKLKDKIFADMHLNNNRLTLLLTDTVAKGSIPNTVKYILYSFELNKKENYSMAEFEEEYFKNPGLKMVTPSDYQSDSKEENSSNEIRFLVFNRDQLKKQEASKLKKFFIVRLNIDEQVNNDVQSKIQTFSVNELLFPKVEEEILLANILISSKFSHRLFFVLQKKSQFGKKSKSVMFCQIKDLEKEHISLDDCALFIDGPVRQFFLKSRYYVSIDELNSIKFCDWERDACKQGVVRKEWEVNNIMLQKEFAVVSMKINKNQFTFINDFKNGKLIWFSEPEIEFNNFLILLNAEKVDKLVMMHVPDDGLIFQDLSFNHYLRIKPQHIETQQRIQLYLENKLVLDYDIQKNSDEKVFNYQPQRKMVQFSSLHYFRTFLDVFSSNLNFSHLSKDSSIDYFSRVQNEILNFEEVKGKEFFQFENFRFYKDQALMFGCVRGDQVNFLDCEIKRIGKLAQPLDDLSFEDAFQIGNIILFTKKESVITHFFDIQRFDFFEPKFVGPFSGGKDCLISRYTIVCKYDESKGSDESQYDKESLRAFIFDKNNKEPTFMEVEAFHNTFNSEVRELAKNNDEGQQIIRVKINSFGFDTVDSDKMSVIIGVVLNDERTSFVFQNFIFQSKLNPKNPTFKLRTTSNPQNIENSIKNGYKMVVMDDQIVLYSSTNTFAIVCFDHDDVFHFSNENILRVVNIKPLASYGLMVIDYESNSKEMWWMLVRLTKDASRQVVYKSPQFQGSHGANIVPWLIDKDTLAFMEKGTLEKELNHYLFYLNGPILTSKTSDVQMTINSIDLGFNFVPDQNAKISRKKTIENTSIEVIPGSEVYPINRYFSFKGNIRDISLASSKTSSEGCLLKKPLITISDNELLTIKEEKLATNIEVKVFEDYTIVKYFDGNVIFDLISKAEDKKKETRTLIFENIPDCDYWMATSLSIICFYTDLLFSKVAYAYISSSILKVDEVILPEKVRDPKILADNSGYISILYLDPHRKYLCLLSYDKQAKEITKRYIGKSEMEADDMRIISFHHVYDLKLDRLTIIFLDGNNNQLFFYYGYIDKMDKIPTIKRDIYLDELDSNINDMKCITDSNSNKLHQCFFFSPTKVHKAHISKARSEDISSFKWKFKKILSVYNAFYGERTDLSIIPNAAISPVALFLYLDKPMDKSQKKLIYYNLALKGSGVSYSDYFYDLPQEDDEKVWAINYQNSKNIEIVYQKGTNIMMRKAQIASYELNVKDLELLDGKTLNMEVDFVDGESEKTSIEFSFAKKGSIASEEEGKEKTKLILLISGMILLSIIILLEVLYLLVLFRDRKKYLNSQAIEEGEADADISYM